MFADRKQFTEYEVHRFVTEASDLGLRPGQWPSRIETNLGNGQPLVAHRRIDHFGEFAGVEYRQLMGCIRVNVLND